MVEANVIERHREELKSVLLGLKRSIEDRNRDYRTHPPRYAEELLLGLREDRISQSDLGHAVRQIHDFYGWKAKDCRERRGVCSGALYRSEGYLMIDPSARNGSRKTERDVHIEHTVPISVLVRALEKQCFATAADLHDFLMRHSVCAALSGDEERLLKTRFVPAYRHDAFKEGIRVADHPFSRYSPLVERGELHLFDIVSCKEIDIESFSFSDHIATLAAASRLVEPSSDGAVVYSLRLFERRSPR
jgi:hypothetical protein